MTNIDEKIKNSIKKLENMDDKKTKEYAKEMENLGLYYYEKEDFENAVKNLEKSLEIHPTINDGYKKLMGIYNSRRAEAARSGDMNEINKWLDKMDDMRNIAKMGTILR